MRCHMISIDFMQALVCVDSPHHAAKAWSRVEQLTASQVRLLSIFRSVKVLSQPIYLLGKGAGFRDT